MMKSYLFAVAVVCALGLSTPAQAVGIGTIFGNGNGGNGEYQEGYDDLVGLFDGGGDENEFGSQLGDPSDLDDLMVSTFNELKAGGLLSRAESWIDGAKGYLRAEWEGLWTDIQAEGRRQAQDYLNDMIADFVPGDLWGFEIPQIPDLDFGALTGLLGGIDLGSITGGLGL